MRRAISVLASLLLPGFGHYTLGRWKRGALWLAVGVLPFLLLVVSGYVGAVAFALSRIAAAIDAAIVEMGERRPDFGPSIGVFFALSIALRIVVGVPVRHFVVEAFKIPSGGMIPTLLIGDHLFVRKAPWFAPAPQRGDVIVFKFPKDPDKDFIQRVIGVGGDVVEIRDGRIVLNGTPVEQAPVDGRCSYEDFEEETRQWEHRRCDAFTEKLGAHHYRVVYDPSPEGRNREAVTVPANSFFVMGDNRDNSHDSRYWGTVPLELVRGTAHEIWFSTGQPEGIRWNRVGMKVE
jgi:signal peptidase I